MNERPGREEVRHGPLGRAFSTSVSGNSAAFGFSIMITTSFGMLTHLEGAPSALEVVLFGLAAATAIAALEGIVTRGFRARTVAVPSEVRLLGTAFNFASVGAGVAVALASAELLGGIPAWPAAALAASMTYVAAESAELLVAERIQRLRGDPQAGTEEQGQ